MKILHTSDWHIGKRLGRHDRMGEFVEVLAEVERIADERARRPGPGLGRRVGPSDPADGRAHAGAADAAAAGRAPAGGRLAGNHDSPELFEALAPAAATAGTCS